MSVGVGKPFLGLGQAEKCGRVKPVSKFGSNLRSFSVEHCIACSSIRLMITPLISSRFYFMHIKVEQCRSSKYILSKY
jgi:hypothetical protein